MADIFISYSRHDSRQALDLVEQLRTAGMEVWIDQHGIEGATSWSKEIAKALQECHTMLLLLSPTSVTSENVAKELSVATQLKKRIVPVQIERVQLEGEFLYHLSGLQRVKITNVDAILRAITGSVQTERPKQVSKPIDERKSLMILPFDDLSPTGDNQWFADGIVSEMISALSYVKALRVTDAATTKDFRRYQGTLPMYAAEMNIRYFVQGDVRKFGDSIKISSRLLDIQTGDHLWQDSMKGTMNDIFDIQEKVAEKVVEGLKVHLAIDEKEKLAEHGTENAEAYELSLKAIEYATGQTKEGFLLSVELCSEAVLLDPNYAHAYQLKANALLALFRTFDRNPTLLDEAETLCQESLRLKPDLLFSYYSLSQIYTYRGQIVEAEQTAKEFIRKDPKNFFSHYALGLFYSNTGQYGKAIVPYEEGVKLQPDYLPGLFGLLSACDSANEREKCRYWAAVALPLVERYLKLHPTDENGLVWRAFLFMWCDRTEDAHEAAIKLKSLKDGFPLYNAACIFGKLGDKEEALRTFRKAIEAGYRNIRLLKEFLTDEKEGMLLAQGTPEYEEIKQMVEQIEAETKVNG